MDKIKYVKLEQSDGSYSDSIPLAVDADHVDVNNETLTNVLGKKASVDDINNLQSEVSSLASGSPLVASSTSEMTDTTRVYVNTTDGKWYYYNGTNWTIGGIYQSSGISNASIDILKLKNNLAEKISNEIGYEEINYFTINGYIDYKTGAYSSWNLNGKYKCTDFINLKYCEYLQYNGNSANDDSGFAFYDENKNYISGIRGYSITENTIINIPSNAIYVRGTSYDAMTIHNCQIKIFKTSNLLNLISNQQTQINKLKGYETEKMYANKNGYINATNGTYSEYSENGKYKCTDFIELTQFDFFETTMNFYASAQGAFYDENKTFLSGITTLNEKNEIPENAKYIRLSDYNANAQQNGYLILVANSELNLQNNIVINCVGDSVTEGMGTNGAHTSNYGKSPYPARLYTILKDNNYNNVSVNNYGHGGERIAEISGRVGGVPIYVSEDVTIPANNDEVSLGTNTSPSGRVSGTKLKQLYSDSNGNDYEVYFTQTSHDTNPVYIDGIAYTMSIHDDANWIRKATADNKETVIKANSLVYTNDNRLPNVNIMYAGINDGASLTLERFIDNMKSCGEINGGKYIVLGSTHSLFNNWSDVQGSTLTEKYNFYHRKCLEAFGNHFIDLYNDFFEHAMEYSLSAGYFTDKTEQELNSMSSLLSQHIIPAEFSYNKSSQGDVHLSEEGYHVIAMLIFDKLKRLNYI